MIQDYGLWCVASVITNCVVIFCFVNDWFRRRARTLHEHGDE